MCLTFFMSEESDNEHAQEDNLARLPQPLYQPMSQEVKSILPPHIMEVAEEDFVGCFCPHCAEGLWARLARTQT